MGVVQCRQQTPKTIHLRIVPIKLCSYKKYRRQKERDGNGGDQRVGRCIEFLETLWIGDGLKDLLG